MSTPRLPATILINGFVLGLIGRPSKAAYGNVLEAMNLTLAVYDKHYIDRDLNRTGVMFPGRQQFVTLN